jgi:hypothetical protein
MCLARIAGWLGRVLGTLVDKPDSDWPSDPRTHDYRRDKRMWGHDYEITKVDGTTLRATGFGPMLGPNIKRGDYLRFSRDGGGIVDVAGETRYRVATIEYKSNPTDMWSAELWWAGRPECQTDWDEDDRWRDPPTAKTV